MLRNLVPFSQEPLGRTCGSFMSVTSRNLPISTHEDQTRVRTAIVCSQCRISKETCSWLIDTKTIVALLYFIVVLVSVDFISILQHHFIGPGPIIRLHWCHRRQPEPLFTKRTDVLPPNLVKFQSCETGCYNASIDLGISAALLPRYLTNFRTIGKA